jgi:hypothetical protein
MRFDERDDPSGRRPTVRQVYALARLLLQRDGEVWPPSRSAASELIERLRRQEGE